MNVFALKFIDVYLPLKNHFALQIPKIHSLQNFKNDAFFVHQFIFFGIDAKINAPTYRFCNEHCAG